jgi:DNA-directed RNA polymerase specialized sigma24 family protein
MDGNKIKDISLILNIPLNTVKSRMFMGRKEMKENIQPILETLDFEIRD